MTDIITWYTWWENIVRREGKEDIVIKGRQSKEFTDPITMTKFEEGKMNEGYETGHGYYLEIP